MVQIAKVVLEKKRNGLRISSEVTRKGSHDGMVRCPDCGCATSNLGFHWAHCPFVASEKIVKNDS
jgi:hypothetical protein